MPENQNNSIDNSSPTPITASNSAEASGQPEPTALAERLLSAEQQQALQQLAAGASIAKAARKAGVHRRTVSRWLESNPQFAAAYNAWRKESIASGRARVTAMADRALDALSAAINKGDARIALQVSRASGVMETRPPGTSDADLLERRRKLREGRREIALQKQEAAYRKESGEDERAKCDDVTHFDGWIGGLLDLRAMALRDEKPEVRSARLMQQQPPASTAAALAMDWLKLYDQAVEKRGRLCEVPALLSPEAPASGPAGVATAAEPDASAPASAPAAATAEPSAAVNVTISKTAGSSVLVRRSTPEALAPQSAPRRARSAAFFFYDGSDEDDNDPNWTRCG